jgi:hypothetical protein
MRLNLQKRALVNGFFYDGDCPPAKQAAARIPLKLFCGDRQLGRRVHRLMAAKDSAGKDKHIVTESSEHPL